MKYIFHSNEKGSALIISVLILLLLTVIGIAATNTSITEIQIAGNEKLHKATFYATEAGIDHVRMILKSLFIENNAAEIAAEIAAGQVPDPDWDFALDGSETGVSAATDTNYDGGSTWITNGNMGTSYTYSVKVWNNLDGGNTTSATDDTDGLIYVRSVGSGPRGAASSIEVLLEAGTTGEDSITGYTAQAGAGAGKNYNANDMNAITDFSVQM